MNNIPQNIPISTENKQKENRIGATENELLTLQRKEQQLLGKYQENSPIIINIRQEIALVQAAIKEQQTQLKDQVTTERNPVYQDRQLVLLNARSDLSSLKTQQGVIWGQIEELDSQISRLNQLEKQFNVLRREVDKDQENLKMYVRKYERANVSTEMDNKNIANVSVIQSASTPIGPIKPRKSLTFYFGMAFGLLSGVAWAFVSDFFKGGYTRPEQASHEQGMPVLASISYKN